ncbi:hypothetical protein MTR67_011929 [Solanum verrucosum]|uniref:Integrase core domain containing protein n=1 Tax=Solanum verrucosum TaxID=315347 RepID=A0AAF0QES5_SOLVR|nr:hypothetical protein MTR67_011929 [Solanum verrucosum]
MMITQMDLLTKHLMGSGSKAANVIRVNKGNPYEVQFKALYNEEVHFLANQGGGLRPNYQSLGRNQGWNRDRDDGWRDRDKEWCDRGKKLRERNSDKEQYVPPHERQKPEVPRANHENLCIEDMFARILNKVEGSDKVLKKMNDDFSSLNQTLNLHSLSIKQFEIQMGQIPTHLNPRPKGGLPTDTMVKPNMKFESMSSSYHDDI